MDMRQEWLTALRAWAAHNSNVRELWLFGSRAKGTADAQSDVDIALLLMPPTDNINWALAAYVEFFDDWKAELRVALNREVSLVAIGSGYEMNTEVRATGTRLWSRDDWRNRDTIV
jgi:predicted nucleotidyltransferase